MERHEGIRMFQRTFDGVEIDHEEVVAVPKLARKRTPKLKDHPVLFEAVDNPVDLT